MPSIARHAPIEQESETTPALGWSLGLDATTPAEIIEEVHQGFSTAALERMRDHLNLTEDQVAEIVGSSPRTLARRRKAGRLDSRESDRLFRFARLFERAVQVFGGDELALEEAQQWFHTPQWGLAGSTPISYALTELGAREVEALLNRIDYGILT